MKRISLLLLLSLGTSFAHAEEIAHYSFNDQKAPGSDETGQHSIPDFPAPLSEGGPDNTLYADFSSLSLECDPAPPVSLKDLNTERSHSVVLNVKPGFIPPETGSVRYFYSLGPSVVRLGVMRTDSGAASFGYLLRNAEPTTETGYEGKLSAAPFDPRVDRWHQVAYTYDDAASLFCFYVNGELRHQETLRLYAGPATLRLGWASGSKGFQGGIDNVRIFTRPLEANELKDLQ